MKNSIAIFAVLFSLGACEPGSSYTEVVEAMDDSTQESAQPGIDVARLLAIASSRRLAINLDYEWGDVNRVFAEIRYKFTLVNEGVIEWPREVILIRFCTESGFTVHRETEIAPRMQPGDSVTISNVAMIPGGKKDTHHLVVDGDC